MGGALGVWGPGPVAKGCPVPVQPERSLVHIAGSKLDLFPVHVGLRQGCPLSLVRFIIFRTEFLGAVKYRKPDFTNVPGSTSLLTHGITHGLGYV